MAPANHTCDIAVVGAGIVGLGCALEAAERGLSVVVLDRDDRAVGASVRNFGHGFVTGQAGAAFEAALVARERWLELGARAGFWTAPTGTLLLARHEDELAVCEELAADERRSIRVLDAPAVAELVGPPPPDLAGGMLCTLDVRVDPRAAPRAIATLLADELGVDVRFGVPVTAVEGTTVHIPQATIEADRVVVAPGHDLDTLFPEVFAGHGVLRSALQMLRCEAPGGFRLDPALITGLSMLRYRAFAACPTLPAVRARIERERPELVAAGIHLIVTQQPDGSLLVGDTHVTGRSPSPFRDERLDELLLAEAERVLGVPLRVRERWLGLRAQRPGEEVLVAAPSPEVRVVAVTSGIGMTTALGLAPRVIDEVLAGTVHSYQETRS